MRAVAAEAHHFIDHNLGDVSGNVLTVNILAGFYFAFNIHLVTFNIIAAFVGYILCQRSPAHEVMPFRLLLPVAVTVTVTFCGC